MAGTDKYDVAVIGAGPGGYVAAIRSAQLGLKTALIDGRERLGGTCLNIGCIPSKALLDASEFYAKAAGHAGAFGVTFEKIALDFEAMLAHKESVVKKLTDGLASLMKANGVEVFRGTASFVDAHRVSITRDAAAGEGETLEADSIIIATGSESSSLPFLPVDGRTVVTSTEALSFDRVPEKLVVVGAGAIGLELGSVYMRLGSDVSVIEIMPQILPGWDAQLAKTLARELGKQGMKILTETRVTSVQRLADEGASGGGKAVLKAAGKDGGEISFEAERVLVAVGRKPFTGGLNLQAAGIEADERGRIPVDERFRTASKNVYAIGDVIRGVMLAHKAEDEGIAAAEIIAGRAGHVNYGAIPGVVYTWPEAASAGRTEEQLKEEGADYRKGVFPFSANGRALAMGAPEGFVKILSDARYDTILGVHIVGPMASDLIAEAVAVMEFRGSAEDLARTVHAHPTLPEVMREAALGTGGRMIHGMNRSKSGSGVGTAG